MAMGERTCPQVDVVPLAFWYLAGVLGFDLGAVAGGSVTDDDAADDAQWDTDMADAEGADPDIADAGDPDSADLGISADGWALRQVPAGGLLSS
ncbi:TPA: hypothetical protein ACH3X1_010291 [Trebouxia sp. C0004]